VQIGGSKFSECKYQNVHQVFWV